MHLPVLCRTGSKNQQRESSHQYGIITLGKCSFSCNLVEKHITEKIWHKTKLPAEYSGFVK